MMSDNFMEGFAKTANRESPDYAKYKTDQAIVGVGGGVLGGLAGYHSVDLNKKYVMKPEFVNWVKSYKGLTRVGKLGRMAVGLGGFALGFETARRGFQEFQDFERWRDLTQRH